jgi:hypothetical protein
MFQSIFSTKDNNNTIKSISSSDFPYAPIPLTEVTSEGVVTNNSNNSNNSNTCEESNINTPGYANIKEYMEDPNWKDKILKFGYWPHQNIIRKHGDNYMLSSRHDSSWQSLTIVISVHGRINNDGTDLKFLLEDGTTVVVKYEEAKLQVTSGLGIITYAPSVEWVDPGKNLGDLMKENKGKAILSSAKCGCLWYFYVDKLVLFYKDSVNCVKRLCSVLRTWNTHSYVYTFSMENGITVIMYHENDELVFYQKGLYEYKYANTDFMWIVPMSGNEIEAYVF